MALTQIAIVGGGPATISLLKQLFDSLKSGVKQPVTIDVYEKSDKIGPGLAYSNSNDCYLLNLPVTSMGITPELNNNFKEWLEKNSHHHSSFPPRHYFGQYLVQVAEALKNKAEQLGIKLNYHTSTTVENIYPLVSGQYIVEYQKSEGLIRTQHDAMILSTGHLPSDTYPHLKAKKNYYDDPWSDKSFMNIHQAASIGVLGTRLTAIDAVLRLKSMGYKGKIFMVSRSGMLPAVLSRIIPPYHLKHITMQTLLRLTRNDLKPLRLDKLLDLLKKEMRDALGAELDLGEIKKTYEEIPAIKWLEKEIREAQAPKPWQQVLFALYPIIPHIWKRLTQEDKSNFMQNYYSLFLTYLAAFPLENAQIIKGMLDEGQLCITGGISDVKPSLTDGGFVINTKKEEITVDALFNATGPGLDLSLNPLFKRMEIQDTIVRNNLGGIKVDSSSFQVYAKNGTRYPSMYAMGNLTIGECLATSDMNQVSHQGSAVRVGLKKQLPLGKVQYIDNSTVFYKNEVRAIDEVNNANELTSAAGK